MAQAFDVRLLVFIKQKLQLRTDTTVTADGDFTTTEIHINLEKVDVLTSSLTASFKSRERVGKLFPFSATLILSLNITQANIIFNCFKSNISFFDCVLL